MGQVGHYLAKAKMLEFGALLAGEMSGSIFFRYCCYGFNDAVYVAGRFLEIVSKTDLPVCHPCQTYTVRRKSGGNVRMTLNLRL